VADPSETGTAFANAPAAPVSGVRPKRDDARFHQCERLRMRTLVVHIGGIGDFLLTCPTLALLGRDGPVELLGQAGRLALAVAGGLADAAHDADRWDFQTLFAEPSERLRRFLSRFDRCVVWIRDEGNLAETIRSCGVKDVRVFPGLPPRDWSQHASRYYLQSLGFEEASPLRLAFEPSDTPRDVVIHPGSGGGYKNWPWERFEALAAELGKRGRAVTWSFGPAEHEFPKPANGVLLRTESLVDLAHELAGARLFVGNDGGITHLAAAVGCPTLALFGPTDPRVWAPLGDHVTALRGTPWPAVDEVLRAIRPAA